MDVSVEIHCAACGSANYSLPEGAGDESRVACNDCGREFGTVADLKAEMMAQAAAHSAEARRRELERILQGPAA
jgi:hypothetical protein